MSLQTKGHLVNQGGIRGHSAGDIFPYIIVLVGNPEILIRYNVIGKGIKIGQLTWKTYKQAHASACRMLKACSQAGL
jgi:hypothetical protein